MRREVGLNMKNYAAPCTLICLIVILSSAPAVAFETEHLTDPEFIVLMSDNAFAAEGRIGDLLGAATFELDIGPEHGNPTQTAQFDWPNGEAVTFTLTFDSVTNVAEFTVGGNVLMYAATPPFTDLFVRARAVDEGSYIVVNSIVLDGEPVGDNASTSGYDGADTLWIKGGVLADGFTITGAVTMNWTGTPPRQSRLAFQVKASGLYPVSNGTVSWGQVKVISP